MVRAAVPLLIGSMALGAPGVVRAQSAPTALSLEQAVARARTTSQEVRLAEAGVAGAEAGVRAARAARLPQLDGDVSYARTFASPFGSLDLGVPDSLQFRPDTTASLEERVSYLERAAPTAGIGSLGGAFGNLPFGREHTYNVALAASQTLYSGGRIGAGERVARAARDAARLGPVEETAEVELQVRRAYWQALLAREFEAITAAALAQAEAFLAQERVRRRAGSGSELDVLRAEVARDNLRPQQVEARNRASLALLDLQRLVDLPLGAPVALTTTLAPPSPAELDRPGPLAAVETGRRAAVAAAAQQVVLREAQLRLARAAFLPAVQLRVNYARQLLPSGALRFDGRWQTDANASLGVQIPVFDGFRRDADVAAARVEVDRARLELERVREGVELQLRQALAERESARDAIATRQATVASAEQVHELVVLRYRAGAATQLEVTQARLELRQARANLAQAVADFRIADAGVARAGAGAEGDPSGPASLPTSTSTPAAAPSASPAPPTTPAPSTAAAPTRNPVP